MNTRWTLTHSIGVLLLIVAIGAVGYFVGSPRLAWILIVVLMFALLVVIGLGVAGRPAGAWIDERNKMTLSRLQLIAWTLIVLSGFLAAALSNLRADDASDPLGVAVPEILWAAMGISTASLVGSPLILSAKKQQEPEEAEATRSLKQAEGSGAVMARSQVNPRLMLRRTPGVDLLGPIRAIGAVEVRPTPADASWADLFRGDETGNFAYVDIGKVQMLLLTVVVLLAYGIALFVMLAGNGPFRALPGLAEGMVAILGISHAGYLTIKAVNHSAPAS